MISTEAIAEKFRLLQDQICNDLMQADGAAFHEDLWDRPEGGGGRTRTIQGNLIEKGGVAFSAVHGPLPEAVAQHMKLPATTFFATGVSIVLHPVSPMAPIIHMNVRYFETGTGRWWFGGGIDLTPHYVDLEDAVYFHTELKAVCDRHNPTFYSQFKAQADDYFYIRHRNETRGIGGIFYDYLDDQSGLTQAQLLAFSLDVGGVFARVYTTLLLKSQTKPWGEREKNWQMLRRGRYVEFNLVWDRGTKFGLETNGRVESILMSMPPGANWVYNHQPEPDSTEAQTLSLLRKGIDWVKI
jgi:coproporphyrinogen III oxidase